MGILILHLGPEFNVFPYFSFFRKLKLRIQKLPRVVLVLTKIETRFNRKLAGLSAKGGEIPWPTTNKPVVPPFFNVTSKGICEAVQFWK